MSEKETQPTHTTERLTVGESVLVPRSDGRISVMEITDTAENELYKTFDATNQNAPISDYLVEVQGNVPEMIYDEATGQEVAGYPKKHVAASTLTPKAQAKLEQFITDSFEENAADSTVLQEPSGDTLGANNGQRPETTIEVPEAYKQQAAASAAEGEPKEIIDQVPGYERREANDTSQAEQRKLGDNVIKLTGGEFKGDPRRVPGHPTNNEANQAAQAYTDHLRNQSSDNEQ